MSPVILWFELLRIHKQLFSFFFNVEKPSLHTKFHSLTTSRELIFAFLQSLGVHRLKKGTIVVVYV